MRSLFPGTPPATPSAPVLALAILIQLLVPALAPPPLWAQRRQPDTVLSLDTDVLGGALSYARAEGPGRYRGVEAGIGDAFLHGGLVSGRHFEDTELFELLHAAVFRRWVPSDRLSADVGARASVFVHVHASGDGPGLPLFAGVYANAMVGGRRLKVGPRVLVGMFSEGSSARGFGVYLVPLSVRFSFGW